MFSKAASQNTCLAAAIAIFLTNMAGEAVCCSKGVDKLGLQETGLRDINLPDCVNAGQCTMGIFVL